MSEYWEERGKLPGILSVEPSAVEADRPKEERFRRQLLAWTTMLMHRAELLPAHHLLDLGCGFGDVSVHLAPHCARITAIDGSSSMIAQARAMLAATAHADWRVEQADLEGFTDIAGDVDLVYLGAVCSYLSDDDYAALLVRIAVNAAPGVAIVQREYVAMNGGWTGITERGNYKSYRRRAQDYIAIAERAGFTSSLPRYSSDMDIELALRFLGPVGRGLATVVRPIGRLALRGKKEGSSTFFLRRAPADGPGTSIQRPERQLSSE